MSDRPLRILYDHQMFALQRFGGVSRIFVELARRLSSRPDCDVSWFRGHHIDGYDVGAFQDRLARYWASDLLGPEAPRPFRDRLNLRGFRRFSRTIPGGVDVYHPTYFDAGLAAIPPSRRVAVTVYDMILERFLVDIPRFRPALEGKRALVERADVVLVISEQTRRDLVELLGVDPSRTALTYLASDMASVDSAPLPEPLRGRPFLLYVGTRSRQKNFAVLPRALARSERLRRELVVACFGGTTPFLEPELELLDELGLRDRFVYIDGGDDVLKALYEHAEALVYTSRYEGFGLPLLEAMEAGCPTVCCPLSSIPEVVGDAALAFDPDDPDELAECLEVLLGDGDLRASLVERGYARARLFSWDRTAEATLAAYRSVV